MPGKLQLDFKQGNYSNQKKKGIKVTSLVLVPLMRNSGQAGERGSYFRPKGCVRTRSQVMAENVAPKKKGSTLEKSNGTQQRQFPWICVLCTHLPLQEEVYCSASFACCLFLFILPPRSLTELLRFFCSGSWISFGNRLFSSNIAFKATKQEWILHQNQGNIWWGALWKSGCRKNLKKRERQSSSTALLWG